MKQFLLKGILFSMLAVGFASCSSDDEEEWIEPQVTTTGLYILNSGKSGNNSANLGYYDLSTKMYTKDIFKNQNSGQILGDIGQDMVIYGSKMYISVTKSNKIYITDLKGKLLKYSDNTSTIIDPKDSNSEPEGPRSTIAHNGKVYVSLQNGYVARIDTTSMIIDKKVKVGANPEQMTTVNNKLYVVNCGNGYGNTVSIIDLNNFTETKKLEVAVNPNYIASDNNNIYILSWGRTWDNPDLKSSFQKIDAVTEKITELGTDVGTKMVFNKDKNKLLIIKEVWESNGTQNNSLLYYDITNNKLETKPFVTIPGNIDLSKAYSISVDPIKGDIYIGAGEYTTNGDMYIFSEGGTYINKFDTGGINPMGAYFITQGSK